VDDEKLAALLAVVNRHLDFSPVTGECPAWISVSTDNQEVRCVRFRYSVEKRARAGQGRFPVGRKLATAPACPAMRKSDKEFRHRVTSAAGLAGQPLFFHPAPFTVSLFLPLVFVLSSVEFLQKAL